MVGGMERHNQKPSLPFTGRILVHGQGLQEVMHQPLGAASHSAGAWLPEQAAASPGARAQNHSSIELFWLAETSKIESNH